MYTKAHISPEMVWRKVKLTDNTESFLSFFKAFENVILYFSLPIRLMKLISS